MAQPTPYNRSALNGETYFTAWTAAHPTTPQPGNKIDQELNAIALTLAQVLVNLALIQRDDGGIANDTVGRDALKSEVVAGVNTPETWLPLTAFTQRDSVIVSALWYWATTSHTSSASFAVDAAAGYWETIFDFTAVVQTLILSSTLPAALGGAATIGSAITAARADHVHQVDATDELYLRNGTEYFR